MNHIILQQHESHHTATAVILQQHESCATIFASLAAITLCNNHIEHIDYCTLYSTANIYTYTPIIYDTVYMILIRHCKHLLVVVYKILSCMLSQQWTATSPSEHTANTSSVNVTWLCDQCNQNIHTDDAFILLADVHVLNYNLFMFLF